MGWKWRVVRPLLSNPPHPGLPAPLSLSVRASAPLRLYTPPLHPYAHPEVAGSCLASADKMASDLFAAFGDKLEILLFPSDEFGRQVGVALLAPKQPT